MIPRKGAEVAEITEKNMRDVYKRQIIDGLKAHDIEKVASSMGNVLEKVTIEEYPVIEQIKNVMKEQGCLLYTSLL